MLELNPKQISFARVRRRLTKSQLAKKLEITSRSLQNYETGAFTPDEKIVKKIAEALNFPIQFFYLDEEMPELVEHTVSFRKLSKMTEAMKGCAFAAGAIALKINQWIEARFNLPSANLPDLSDLAPEDAAAALRRMWGLGNAPIPNMIHLLESKGVRVFSLVEEMREVDAFCTWYEEQPFIFLNTLKSAERSRFDAAHELGHLVRDVYSMRHGQTHGPEMEKQADEFAAAFLMPMTSILANPPPAFTIKYLMKLKHHWKVSLVAIAYRFNTLKMISEWNYRSLCIEIAKHGFRTKEPEPLERETSQLLSKVMDHLQSKKQGRKEIAESLSISIDEINALTFQLTKLSVVVTPSKKTNTIRKTPPELKLV